MKRLEIPQSEKDKGMLWAVYEVVNDKDWWELSGEAELQIRQGAN